MTESLRKEIEKIIKKLKLKCDVETFEKKVDWVCVSHYQNLSEAFIERYKDKVDWRDISYYQKLSEEFIEKYKQEAYILHL
jgi:ADP-dependent phosphofructokinase/glucokinase